MTDSGYFKSGDVKAFPTFKRNGKEDYFGSTAYWMTKLKYALENKETDGLRNIINHAVIAVDKENKTHINSDGVGREQLTDRIMKKVETLIETLGNVQNGKNLLKN